MLRRHLRSDAAQIARLLDNWNVVRWLAQVPHPYSERDALDWIQMTARNWASGADRQFVATLGEGGPVVGHVGLRSDGTPGSAELGYWLGEPWWGLGYGTEAARAVLGFGFGAAGLERIWATALPDNRRSLAVLRKAGLRPQGHKLQEFATLGRVVEVPLLALTRAEFLAPAAAPSAAGRSAPGPAA